MSSLQIGYAVGIILTSQRVLSLYDDETLCMGSLIGSSVSIYLGIADIKPTLVVDEKFENTKSEEANENQLISK